MKTIATAAVLMMLAAPAWADEAENEANDPTASEPIVLSDAELDDVTAGVSGVRGEWQNTTHLQDGGYSTHGGLPYTIEIGNYSSDVY